MQEIIATGKTTDEAIDQACADLGLSRDEVTIEILEMPQKKLFGTTPAKVKVTAREEAFSVKDLLSGAEQPAQKPAQAQPAAAPQRQEITPARRPASFDQKKEKEPVEVMPEPAFIEEYEEEIDIASLTGSAALALDYLRGLAQGIGAAQLQYGAVKTERGVKFVLDGDDASLIIGRRGETMDAIQYLCTLVGNRSDEDYCKVSLDVANYRKKREVTLRSLAAREAAKVKKSKYNQTLEPMNPYERRIVHSAVQEIEGVKSESIGTEPNRRVVISLISGGKQGNRDNRDNRGGRGGRGGNRRDGGRDNNRRYDDRKPNDNRTNEPPQKTSAQIADEYKPANDVPLYGKIEF